MGDPRPVGRAAASRRPGRHGPAEFKSVMQRWMHAYCACDAPLLPGVTDEQVSAFTLPALVFRSGQAICITPVRRLSA